MQLLESTLNENQLRITKYEEAIGVKDQVSFNPKKARRNILSPLLKDTLTQSQLERERGGANSARDISMIRKCSAGPGFVIY